MKFIGLAILICCFLTFTVGNSVTIKCNYYMSGNWPTYRRGYQCDVQNKEVFTGERVTIENVEGNHENGKSDDDVKFFFIDSAYLKYFPRNLENVFKNLELIFIQYSKLIEITSEDLKPFPKLKNFKLYENPIEVIREDLFIHNIELEVLDLYKNEINHIYPKALSHLNKLRAIDLRGNVCEFDKNQATTRSEVLEIIKKIEQGQCLSPKYTTTTTTENPLILENKQLKQQNEQKQNKNLKLKNVPNKKEKNVKKLAEENQKLREIIEEQDKELKEQKTKIENMTLINQEIKDKIKNIEAKNEEMEKNIEKILKISEKAFEKFEKQNSDLANIHKIIEKLEKHEIKSQNDFIKLSTNYESLNYQFSNFTLLVHQLMETIESRKH
ncbi:hypothetical protein PVAND_009962 [Polypedilum vanderplanki]|uniref:Leucine rich repeat protein n=1 Tax=Polypedilum vanderplanki TaxID=319348 RepID=A0A9J6CFR5_POLVA|nr:hypothetical protein PVAND_009962 [Polypedilum vanderplanki]